MHDDAYAKSVWEMSPFLAVGNRDVCVWSLSERLYPRDKSSPRDVRLRKKERERDRGGCALLSRTLAIARRRSYEPTRCNRDPWLSSRRPMKLPHETAAPPTVNDAPTKSSCHRNERFSFSSFPSRFFLYDFWSNYACNVFMFSCHHKDVIRAYSKM